MSNTAPQDAFTSTDGQGATLQTEAMATGPTTVVGQGATQQTAEAAGQGATIQTLMDTIRTPRANVALKRAPAEQ